MSALELDHIMAKVDTDMNGFVEFEEFVIASVFPKHMLKPDMLKKAFNLFDTDSSGAIELEELKEKLVGDKLIPEIEWEEFIKGVDEDGSGEINMEEFVEMISSYFE